jgi:hypothetical protein
MLRVTSSIRQADISTAQATPGLFTENCFVLAEGEMHAGVFKVTTLAKPSVRRALVGLPVRPPARPPSARSRRSLVVPAALGVRLCACARAVRGSSVLA